MKINTHPVKEYFIKTIVKDIHLVDAVLDLIDNSIDSYIKNNMSDRKDILINISKSKFIIEDNCGGMKKSEISDRIFRLGLTSQEKEGTIGVYGIGMKRAIFKIGENILIESDDGKEYCSILIDKKWLSDDTSWDLETNNEKKSGGTPFTRITITSIFPNIANEMESDVFKNKLRERIKDTHSIFIEDKVTIKINGNSVTPYNFKFLCDNKNFVPFHKKYKFDGVDVEIFAGYTPIERSGSGNPHGWYIFCNDRLVVRNDTSEKTGWGFGERRFHSSEDVRFLGLTFFRSKNSILLPWQTTKEDIQEDSRIYRSAQVEMRSITTRLIDVIRVANKTTDPKTHETIGKTLFENIPPILQKLILKESEEKVPAVKIEGVYKKIDQLPELSSIQYTETASLVRKVKEKLGRPYMSNKKMGMETFKYFAIVHGIKDIESQESENE